MTDTHPLSPLAHLVADAQEWRSRAGVGIGTWTRLWLPDKRPDIEALVAAHTVPLDDGTIAHLRRAGVLPGVRDYAPQIDPAVGSMRGGQRMLPDGSADAVRETVA